MDNKFLAPPYYNLYFVRHGLSVGNYFHILGGWMDLPLTDLGREELRELKNFISYPTADQYLHSGMRRASETLSIITEKLPEAKCDWRFSESYFGTLEGSVPETFSNNQEFYSNFYKDVRQGYGEEVFSDQARRVRYGTEDLLSYLKNEKKNSSYIFCHYGTIKSNLMNYSDIPDVDDLFLHPIPNGSLWHFLFEEANEGNFTCQLIRSYTKDSEPYLYLDRAGLGDEKTLL